MCGEEASEKIFRSDFVATVETFEEDIRHFFSLIKNFDLRDEEGDRVIAREAQRLRLNASPPAKVAIIKQERTLFKDLRRKRLG